MQRPKTILIVLLIITIFNSCQKKDEIAPVINLITPLNNQVLPGNQPINIKAMIKDENGLYMVHIMVLDNSNNGHLLHTEEHINSRNLELNKTFTPQAGKTYTIEVGAHDHSDNESKKIIVVSTN
jgi:hypothetical protein